MVKVTQKVDIGSMFAGEISIAPEHIRKSQHVELENLFSFGQRMLGMKSLGLLIFAALLLLLVREKFPCLRVFLRVASLSYFKTN